MTEPADMSEEEQARWDEGAELVERQRLRDILDTALSGASGAAITEKTHARCVALLDGKPDPYPDPPPEPEPAPEPACALSDEQTMRIAVRVMEVIQDLGAPHATAIDVAKILGIAAGIGRAIAPPGRQPIFDAAFRAGSVVAQSWAAGHRAAGETADS